MEYTKRRRVTINTQVSDLEKVYPHDVQMYVLPPGGKMQLTEFQALGLDRLKLLRHIEANAVRTDFKTIQERKAHLENALTKDGLKYFAKLLQATGSKANPTESDLMARKKDHISHFIMRLSCAHDPDRKTWFMNQEAELFRLRFSSLHKDGIESLLKLYKIKCQQISQEEKDDLREQLHVSTAKLTSVDTTEFYKVPFKKVFDLVRTRKAFLMDGYAYISQTDLGSLFLNYFKENLAKGMASALSNLDNIEDDERLTGFLYALPSSFSGMTRVVWSTTETPIEKLDELSRISYPLCMRILHEGLRTNHHLKHSGRLQYGLFLKGIGVSLEDSLTFWRSEFAKKIDASKFDKEYAYAIRHTYGKEGRQTNYTPFGCVKVVQSSVGPGEYHGCPFKHMDTESLKMRLVQYGVPLITATEICSFSKEGNYGTACSKYFEVVHKQLPERPIIHPNAYFAESRALLSKDTNESEGIDRLSQGGRMSDRGFGTPRQRDRMSNTPSRFNNTPDRFSNTPSSTYTPGEKIIGTPSRKTDRQTLTPVRRLVKSGPRKMEGSLNDAEIAQLMEDDY